MAAIELLKRGVHKAPYLVDGWPALIVIDARHWARKHVKLVQNVDETKTWLRLWDWLEKIDPAKIKLVDKPDPMAPSPLVDPCLRETHLDHALRLAGHAAKRMRRFSDY